VPRARVAHEHGFGPGATQARSNMTAPRKIGPQQRQEIEKMMLQVSMQPVLAIIAGILILVMPRLLNYIVAIFLILYGIIGLMH